MAHLPYFLCSLVWNYGLGMSWLVVPLYAHEQGLGGAEIGTLFSLPVAAQIAVNLIGGAYTDRFGGRRIMLAASLLMTLAALQFMFARDFWALFAGQLLMVLSRATFWPANWALASELPGERGAQLGRLNAITGLGQILGNASCGFILAAAGFAASFALMAAIGLAAWGLGLATPRPTPAAAPERGLFAHFPALLRLPILYYAVMCAYVSALPFSLSMSFYPLLLKHLGYAAGASGLLIALRALGAIGAGLLIARFVRTGPASAWPVAAGVTVALSVGLLPLAGHWSAVGASLLAVGIGSGLMTVYFQMTLGEIVAPAMRGSAMALGGLGWGISHFTTPLVMGLLTDRYGLVAGFYAIGGLALGAASGLALLRRWAFARTRLAA